MEAVKEIEPDWLYADFIHRFHNIKLRIPSMFVLDTYAAFIDGLKLVIAPHVDTLAQAQTMVVKVDLYLSHEGKDPGAGTNAGKDGHGGVKFAE